MRRSENEKRKRKHLPPITALLLALVILAGAFTVCAVKEQAPDDGRVKVVTTILPPYDFARAISGNGELAHVRMLLKPGEEIHSYEPTPQDIRMIQFQRRPLHGRIRPGNDQLREAFFQVPERRARRRAAGDDDGLGPPLGKTPCVIQGDLPDHLLGLMPVGGICRIPEVDIVLTRHEAVQVVKDRKPPEA